MICSQTTILPRARGAGPRTLRTPHLPSRSTVLLSLASPGLTPCTGTPWSPAPRALDKPPGSIADPYAGPLLG